jgi:urease accessory protein
MSQPPGHQTAAAPQALLQLMQLASPALPVGGFSYSEGLEAAVEAGLVRDEAQAGDWLVDQLRLSLERADLPVLAQALPAWQAHDLPRIAELNDWVQLTRESAELRQQTQQMGRSLAEWLKNRPAPDARVKQLAALRPAPAWPVAFALAAAQAGAPARDALLAFGFGWAENMVQAAMRSVPLGQSAAQRMLARLIDALPDAAQRAAALADDQRQAFTPMLAILSAQHETQYSRLFRS